MTKFVNLTPHEVNVYSQDGKKLILSIPPSGKVARVSVTYKTVKNINGIPVNRVEYGEIVDLPEPEKDTIYIVSVVVLMALKSKGINRSDVLSPDTNPHSVIRDEKGQIIGVKAFQTL